MTITTYSIQTTGSIFGPYGITDVGKSNSGSAVAFGGGAFLTASHLVDEYVDYSHDFRADKMSIGVTPYTQFPFNTMYNLRQFNPTVERPDSFDDHTQLNDLAVVEQPQLVTPASALNPVVVFADASEAAAFFGEHATSSIILFGQESQKGASGTFTSDPVVGQFNASMTAISGDSGGAASINIDETEYVLGIVDASEKGETIFSYLTEKDYDAASMIAGDQDYSGMAPDVIYGQANGDVIRGMQRKADIITTGDDNIILAGSGGGLINTGVGKDDVIFMPSAVGQTDSGTTVVVSPGTSTIVGGGPNDKLVLLADRLTPAGGSAPASDPSDTSDTIQLMGGYSFTNNDAVYSYSTGIVGQRPVGAGFVGSAFVARRQQFRLGRERRRAK